MVLKLVTVLVGIFIGLSANATESVPNKYGHALEAPRLIMSDLKKLDRLGLPTIRRDEALGVGVASVRSQDEWRILADSHASNRCAGFQRIDDHANIDQVFSDLRALNQHDIQAMQSPVFAHLTVAPSEIEALIAKANVDSLKAQIQWISSYPSRYHNQSNPNVHVGDLVQKLNTMLQASGLPGMVETISHSSTNQKTVHLRLEGKSRPNEIVVLGAHFDSISGWFGSGAAPGADDDASGSANILETLRIILEGKQSPERSLEFFWYAGEEAGLLGSEEIADTYRRQNKDVVSVLQLDMTLFPGEGEFVIGNITDFTNAWMRDYFKQMNERYLKIQLVEDQCGYGCSDHASWHKRGFATLLPFEAKSRTMNRNIHTPRDVIDSSSNFRHANVFTKLALVYAWDMGNSTARPL